MLTCSCQHTRAEGRIVLMDVDHDVDVVNLFSSKIRSRLSYTQL